MNDRYYQYGKNQKKIMFSDTDKRHADLKLKLRRDGLTQVGFFQSVVTGYIEGDENISAYIAGIKEKQSKIGKRKAKKCLEDIGLGKSLLEDFGLSERDKEFVFDLIENQEEE